jgi:hypothetical protein
MAPNGVLATMEWKNRMEELAAKKSSARMIRWNGSAVDFADWIYLLFLFFNDTANTETEAFELASEHFCQRNGRPFKARSLQVNRKNRNDLKR